MFGEERTTSPNFASYSAPNPNLLLTYYDTEVTEPINHPLGSDPYASPYQHPRDYDGQQARPEFDHDTTAASRIGILTQTTDSTTYEHPGGTLNETTTVSRTSHSYGRFGVVTEHVMNDVTLTTMQSENIPLIQCEVCDLTCNSEDVLERHKQGKKHLKNMQKLAIASAIGPKMPPPIAIEASAGKLENKKHKLLQNGASANSLIFCDVCNVVCNNQDVFRKHLVGKKHNAKATRLADQNGLSNPTSGSTPPVQPSDDGTQKQAKEEKVNTVQSAWCELCKVNCNSYEVLNIHISGKKHLNKLKNSEKIPGSSTPMENPKSTQGKAVNSEGKSAWCELCGIGCNNYDMLKIHIAGKKHQKNLEKSEKPIGPNPAPTTEPPTTPQIIGPLQNLVQEEGKVVKEKRSVASQEDLETKRQKILKGGVAPDSLRTCTVCNVVCNSPAVFISHLAGQKHTQMAVKQAEAQSSGEQA